MVDSFSLTFSGYYPHEDWRELIDRPGIFCVYTCVTPHADKASLIPGQLLYIGYANHSVNDRVNQHERFDYWCHYLRDGEYLCTSCCPVDVPDNARCAAAMIYHHKPTANREYKRLFPFPDTHICLSGDVAGLDADFNVCRRMLIKE